MTAPSIPQTMRAWKFYSTKGGLERNLKLNPATPIPKRTKPNEHLIKVLHVAVNPSDYKFADIGFVDRFLLKHPATPCLDFAGKIVQPAEGSPFKPGQVVYGVAGSGPTAMLAGGALAEYTIAEKDHVGVDPVDAATIPTAGLAAYQSLFNNIKAGSNVFLNGGSGGVGSFGIQLAKARGLNVTTTCSTPNVEVCKKLGADAVINYKQGSVVAQLQKLAKKKQYDLVIDNAGNGLGMYYKMHTFTQPTASFVTIAGSPSLSLVWDMTKAFLWPGFLGGGKRSIGAFVVAPKTDDMEQIAALVKEGKVKPLIDSRFSFEDAHKAFERSRSGRAVGKIVVDAASTEAGKS